MLEAYADHVAEILSDRKYMRPVRVAYSPDSRRLTLVLDLPRASGIPAVKAYKYVAARDEVVAEPRKEAEVRRVYQAAIARLALCAVDYAASVTSPALVGTLAVNAHVSTKDPATGLPVSPCLVTFLTGRERFAGIVLDERELDPARCLRHLDARVSPDPLGLEPVTPIVDFEAERSAPAARGRVDLMALSPSDFEHLIERLFLAMGYNAWKTRDSRDDGVDAVVTRDDLALGGVCVVQAKRTKNTVPVAIVRELAGTMQVHKAHTGMVVATSTFGPASYAFAEQVGRIRLVDQGTLRVLLKTHLWMDAVAGSPSADPPRTDSVDPPPAGPLSFGLAGLRIGQQLPEPHGPPGLRPPGTDRAPHDVAPHGRPAVSDQQRGLGRHRQPVGDVPPAPRIPDDDGAVPAEVQREAVDAADAQLDDAPEGASGRGEQVRGHPAQHVGDDRSGRVRGQRPRPAQGAGDVEAVHQDLAVPGGGERTGGAGPCRYQGVWRSASGPLRGIAPRRTSPASRSPAAACLALSAA